MPAQPYWQDHRSRNMMTTRQAEHDPSSRDHLRYCNYRSDRGHEHYKPIEFDYDSACRMTLKYYYRRYFIALKTL